VDDKTVGTVRYQLEGTAEIPQLTATTGVAGKSRPARKPTRYTLIDDRPEGIGAPVGGTCPTLRGLRRGSVLFARDTMFYFNFVRPVLENRVPGATGHQKHHHGKHSLPHNDLPVSLPSECYNALARMSSELMLVNRAVVMPVNRSLV
jgi:hypothetical protein